MKHSPTSLDPSKYGKVCERIKWETNQIILFVSAQQFLNSYGSKESVLLYFQPSCQTAAFNGVYSRSLFCAQTERSGFGAASILLELELLCQLTGDP